MYVLAVVVVVVSDDGPPPAALLTLLFSLTNSSLETTSNFQFRLYGPISSINPAHFGRFDSIFTLALLLHSNSHSLVIFFSIFSSCRLTIVMSANNSAGSGNAWDDDWEKQADVCFYCLLLLLN